MHINRESIIDAALSLLDAYGLGDVTMRRVASSLGVAPGALYWHIANKQALIAALAEDIISPVSGESLEAISLNLRDLLLARRDGAEVVIAGLPSHRPLPGITSWRPSPLQPLTARPPPTAPTAPPHCLLFTSCSAPP